MHKWPDDRRGAGLPRANQMGLLKRLFAAPGVGYRAPPRVSSAASGLGKVQFAIVTMEVFYC